MTSERVGVFGGTFDPIHYGHLAIAAEARWACDLAQVLFVVAAQQPLKARGHVATPQQRLDMVRLACADEPAFMASDIELHAPTPSYTVATLQTLRQQLAANQELWFILGADALRELPRWHEAQRLIKLAQIVVVGRPGATMDLESLDARLPGLRERTTVLEGPHLAISSTALRERLAEQRPVRYQLPDAVRDYINQHQLYQHQA